MKLISGLMLALLVTGCSVNKDWVALGGSKADGTIKLGVEHGEFETPVTSDHQAKSLAALRCAAWGYGDAEPFGGVLRTCAQGDGWGCHRWLVTTEFQCLDKKTASNN